MTNQIEIDQNTPSPVPQAPQAPQVPPDWGIEIRGTNRTSGEIGRLAGALAKAQGGFKVVEKTKVADFLHDKGRIKYNYADLAMLMAACKESLAANGLAVTQLVNLGGEGVIQIVTLLAHESGEWIQSTLKLASPSLKTKDLGGTVTYGRRYAYGAIVGVASADEDEDPEDVGHEKPEQKPEQKGSKKSTVTDSKGRPYDKIKTGPEVAAPPRVDNPEATKQEAPKQLTPEQIARVNAFGAAKRAFKDNLETELTELLRGRKLNEMTEEEAKELQRDIERRYEEILSKEDL